MTFSLLTRTFLLAAALVLAACRAQPAPPLPTPTATSIPLSTEAAVVIPTTTPAPTATNTPPPTATPLPPTATATAPASPTPEVVDVVTVQVGANVRTGPSTLYPVIGGLDPGATAPVVGRDVSGTWFAIAFEDAEQAWIAGTVVSYEGQAGDLPVITVPPPPVSPTPRATNTPVFSGSASGSSNGLNGRLTLCNQAKAAYAVNERICFVERIENPGAEPITYGILGVLAVNTATGGSVFQTSWSAQLAEGGRLRIDPGCTGPTDTCGGPWEDGMRLAAPGTYRLVLSVCFSDYSTCLGDDGSWAAVTGPIVVSVN